MNNVRLSGKNATDQTGKPGPTNVCASLRLLRSITATEPRMPAAATRLPVGRDCDSDDGRRRCFDFGKNVAARRQEVNLAVRPGCNDLTVGRNRDIVERRRQTWRTISPPPDSGQMRTVAS